ncbi:unnamed protein product [Prunus armeniaca]
MVPTLHRPSSCSPARAAAFETRSAHASLADPTSFKNASRQTSLAIPNQPSYNSVLDYRMNTRTSMDLAPRAQP